MALPDHVEANLVFGHNDQVARCKLYYAISAGGITVANITAVCDEFRSVWNSVIIACLPSSARFDGVEMRNRLGALDVEGRSSDAPDNGTAAAQMLPEEDCVVMRRHTGKAGRSKRGRIFFPFVPDELQSSGHLTPDAIGTYKAVAYKMKIPIVLAVTGVTLTPKQPDFKNSLLETVTETQLVLDVLNRRDRRNPKQLVASATAP